MSDRNAHFDAAAAHLASQRALVGEKLQIELDEVAKDIRLLRGADKAIITNMQYFRDHTPPLYTKWYILGELIQILSKPA